MPKPLVHLKPRWEAASFEFRHHAKREWKDEATGNPQLNMKVSAIFAEYDMYIEHARAKHFPYFQFWARDETLHLINDLQAP